MDEEPTVFATKMYNGSWSESEGNPGNPGTGTLGVSTDHRFRIAHNPQGDDAKRYEMYRDQLYFGFYNQSRMQSGGAAVAGNEAFGLCDDFQLHMWNLDRQADPGPWADWNAVHMDRR
ncbi:MAG: hypothetical protein WD096_04225 [Actinomycetota bacterium]